MKLTKKKEEQYIKEGRLIPLFVRQYCPVRMKNRIIQQQIDQGIINCEWIKQRGLGNVVYVKIKFFAYPFLFMGVDFLGLKAISAIENYYYI